MSKDLKKTKIVATISDLNCSEEFVHKLYDSGMNVVRLNTAHQDFEGTKKVMKNVKKVSDKIPFLLDTKGPEIRTCDIEEGINIKKGEKIWISGEKNFNEKGFKVNYEKFCKDVSVGNKILIDDGELELEIIKKENNKVICQSRDKGIIKNKKSVNVPGAHMNLPALSKKDRDYVEFAIENKIDFIAHSFVRNKDDVLEIQKILDKKKSEIKIIAKIENQEGVDNIDEILDVVYGVMIARGDLAVEISYEKVPHIQRDIVEKCIEKRKPVIVATQMLHSMINNPRPTRAEVSDIANAIYLGADAIMLSGETAYGEHPLKAVRVMSKISEEIEKNKPSFDETAVKKVDSTAEFMAKSAVRASLRLPTKAIVIDTMTGRTAKYISAFRGKNRIYAICYNKNVMRELALSYGVYASYRKKRNSSSGFNSEILVPFLKEKEFKKEDLLAVVGGSFGPANGASFLEISTVENLIKEIQ